MEDNLKLRTCICARGRAGHLEFMHEYPKWHWGIDSNGIYNKCPCIEFKQDNLKYLEERYNEQSIR